MLPDVIEQTIDKLKNSLIIYTRDAIQDILNTHEFICLKPYNADLPFVGYECKKCNYSLGQLTRPGINFKIHTCNEWVIKTILE